MKTVGIDCRFAGGLSGLGRYTREIVSNLLQLELPFGIVLFVYSKDEDWISEIYRSVGTHDLASLQNISTKKKTNKSNNIQIIEVPFRHYSLSEQIHLPKHIRKANIDLLFSPHFNVPLRCPVPFVVTIHDLILHRYPNQANIIKQIAYKMLMKHAVWKSRAIISVSNFTAREIVDIYDLPQSRFGNLDDLAQINESALRQKIYTIHEGIGDQFVPQSDEKIAEVRKKYDLLKKYFLYVGNAKQHKNVQTLIDAFEKADIADVELILVTGGKEAGRLKVDSNKIRFLSGVDDRDLPALYCAAKCFVTPSLYEGFCFPVAEAQACGCPVIASNLSAIPEVASSEVVLIEPTIENLRSALENPPMRVEKVELDWGKAVEKTAQVLRDVISL